VELSSLNVLESGESMTVNDPCNKNNHGQTGVILPSDSVTQGHLESATTKFADILLEEQDGASEITQLDIPTEDSVISADSAAASLTPACSVSDHTSCVLPSQGSSSVSTSSAVHADNPPDCSPAPENHDQPAESEKPSSSRRKKRNKSSQKNDATLSSVSTPNRCV